MKRIFLLCTVFLYNLNGKAQCDTTTITGNLIISSDMFLSGIINVSGTFQINAGVTVYVMPYSVDNCGKLIVNAQEINIWGNINGDHSGYPGGQPGFGGTIVSSLTGDLGAIDNCSNKDNTGQITVQAGQGGTNGSGSGAGLAGLSGTNGSGPKQQCLTSNDEAGMIGSAGGAGGGGGGSYGGAGSVSQKGGDGTDYYSTSGVNVSTGFVVMGGNGGTGGNPGTVYGTFSGNDIDAGSGGAGSGGGGRSYETGLAGNAGGSGGAMITLNATDILVVSGIISVNGEDGKNGGNAGNGGESPKCCSDGCDDCGEATLSCGAGGGSGSGGGSGGGILLICDNYANITGALNANGGDGGFGGGKGNGTSCTYDAGLFCGSDQTITSGDGFDGGKGGAGGGGRIKIIVNECSTSMVTPTTSVSAGSSISVASDGTYYLNCNFLWVEELEDTEPFSIYPNPTSDFLTIDFSSIISGYVFMLDVDGKVIFAKHVNGINERIDISSFPSGIYLVQFVSNGKTATKKVVKK